VLALQSLGHCIPHVLASGIVVQRFSTLQATGVLLYPPLTGLLRGASVVAHSLILLTQRVACVSFMRGLRSAGSLYCPLALARRQGTWRGNTMCALTESFLSLLLLILLARWLHQKFLASTRTLVFGARFPRARSLFSARVATHNPRKELA